MKGIFYYQCLAALGALMLSSCNLGSDANAVNDPTVDQMAELEKQWGLKPRETRPRFTPNNNPSAPGMSPDAVSLPIQSPVPFPSTPPAPVPDGTSTPTEVPSIPPSLR